MNLRKITSLTALLSFIVLLLTSIILFIVPHGRVAYWSDWRLFGLTRTHWGNLHINIGLLFLIAIGLHIYLNFKPIINYLKNQAKRLTVFTREFTASLVLLLLFTLGTFFSVPPFVWILDANTAIKERGSSIYGEPPYGHAELSSLKVFAQKTGLDLDDSMARLERSGLKFTGPKQTIQEIADLNHIKPKEVYLAMLPETAADTPPTLPETPNPGIGRLSLTQLAEQYSLDLPSVLKALTDEGFIAEPDMTIKTIAERNQSSPVDIYMAIKNAADKNP